MAYKQNILLDDYTIINTEKAIETVANEYNAQISVIDEGELYFVDEENLIALNKKILFQFPSGEECEVAIKKASLKDYTYLNKKYMLSITPLNCQSKICAHFALRVFQAMKETIPERFISLEHFLQFLAEPVKIDVISIDTFLVSAASKALQSIFADWDNRGCIKPKNSSYTYPSIDTIRIEINYQEYRFIEIKKFTIYRKGSILVAAGINVVESPLSGKKIYIVTIYCKKDDFATIQSMFSGNFEHLLFSSKELKGGKFTGDLKIIKQEKRYSMDDIVLDDATKQKIENEIFNFFALKSYYKKAQLPFKRGVALYGPTGTGKTMIAKIIASQMKETVLWVKAGDLRNTDDINRIFRMARFAAPSVLILEDIDFYASNRHSPISDKIGVATLMANLDGLEENEDILVIVTTNRLEVLEKAIVDRPGRIDTKIYLGELTKRYISKLLHKKLDTFERDFESFAHILPDDISMTGSDVVELASKIMRNSIVYDQKEKIFIKKETVKFIINQTLKIANSRAIGF